ncbi:MAG: EAL domain-containing protein [Magnetospirillum sp.]|nr:EAL domain-containing protein [Magnetospirillum sp.]
MTTGVDGSHELYVAFAFAAADLLVETDAAGTVDFAVGAALRLLGRPARLLSGTAVTDLVAPGCRDVVKAALARMAAGERVRAVPVDLQRSDGDTVTAELSGYRHPDHPACLLVALGEVAAYPLPARRVPASGLLDRETFHAVAMHLLHASAADRPYRLSVVELPNLPALRAAAGSQAAEGFVAALGDRLKGLSVGGDAAGQLGACRYGLIHSGTVDPGHITRAVNEAAVLCAPSAPCPEAAVTSQVLDVAGVPPGDVARALTYTLARLADQPEDIGTNRPPVGEVVQARLSATVREMQAVRAIIARGDFDVWFQPIVDLSSNVVHHFECLVRFSGDAERSPYETVVFAEDTGLVGELDLALVTRVVAALETGPLAETSLRFAVNLSGRTLSDPRLVGRLRPMLGAASERYRGRLLFELTESAFIHDLGAVNAVLQEIRRLGFPVCLDDFGAGHAAFHYLRALEVDHVKIDGSYIKGCLGDDKSVSFIKAIVQLCGELGISTTAEYVENAEIASLLKLLKVRYGQGWWFGKPMRPTHPARRGDRRTPWVTPVTAWKGDRLHFRRT